MIGETKKELIRICAACNKIFINDRWITVNLNEINAEFLTHGICPECTKKLYPEFAEKCIYQPAAA